MRRLFIFVCLIVLCPTLSWACDICVLHQHPSENNYFEKGVYAGLFEQFTHFGKIKSSTTTLHNENDEFLDSSITQLYGGYYVNKQLGFQLTLPVIYRSFQRMEEGSSKKESTGGLGDISMSVQFRPFYTQKNDYSFHVTFLGGLKLPTGSTKYLKEEAHEEDHHAGDEGDEHGHEESNLHGHDLSLGSGSIDGMIGTGIFARWKKAFIASNIQYAIKTEGTINYRYANELTWNVKPGYNIFRKQESVVSLALNTAGDYKKNDTMNGESEAGTGIIALFMGPDIGFKWRKKITASLGAELPLFQDASGTQLVSDYKIKSTFSFNF